jgi:putative transposase
VRLVPTPTGTHDGLLLQVGRHLCGLPPAVTPHEGTLSKTIGQICQEIGVSEQTFYRWKNRYGGMKVGEVKRLKELEEENLRLKKLVGELALDNAALKDLAEGNF